MATSTAHGLAYATGGDGPPVLLLHGFPQTQAMWAKIAPGLARGHRVICADLPGYGASAVPEDVAGSSFRAMGSQALALMDHLGHDRFAVLGHDRGARVAHRLCLDAPDRITAVTLMDIVPTHTLLTELTHEVARVYYHWFFLAQPSPLPERMITPDPDAYFESCLGGWGGAGCAAFDPNQLDAYRAAWRQADIIRGMLNDYRAGLDHDLADDEADLGNRIRCPAMILYGEDGVMARHYDMEAVWAPKCTFMEVAGLPGGHFFPDTAPEATADALATFLASHAV